MNKKEFHMNAWSGLNCFSEQSDISDDEFSQNWNASLDKYGVVRFSGGAKKYGRNHPHTNTNFVPGGGLFSYSTDYTENILSSDFTIGYFVDFRYGYIKSQVSSTISELYNIPITDNRYTIFNTPTQFDNMMIHIYAGPGKGQTRKITNWTGDGSDDTAGNDPLRATIDSAWGHADSGTDGGLTIQAIEGENIRLGDVAKVRIWNEDVGAFGDKGLMGLADEAANGYSTLTVTDRTGRKLHLHFTHSSWMTGSTFEKSTSSDSTSPFYGTDGVNTHYLINANATAAVVVDRIVAAVTEATDGANDYISIAAVDCTTVASGTNPTADVVLFKDDSGHGEGVCNLEYTGWFDRINKSDDFPDYFEDWHGNPISFNTSLDIYQPFVKGLGSTHIFTYARVQVDNHQWQVGEYVSLKGITGKTAYNRTFRIEWVADNYIYINTLVSGNAIGGSSSGGTIAFSTPRATTRPSQSGFTDQKSYYKIYKWNFSPTGATSPWHKASSQTTALFSNAPYGVTDANIETLDSGGHTGTIFKKEIASSASPGLSPWNRILTANTFIYSSGKPASVTDVQNKAVDLGYIEQTDIPLIKGTTYQLSFDMNFLTPWKMWAADGDDSDILPGVLIYSPTAGSPEDVADGQEKDYVLMSDGQWIKSNEPVSGNEVAPFTNCVRNGDFKEAVVTSGSLVSNNYIALANGSTDITSASAVAGADGIWTVANGADFAKYRLLKNEIHHNAIDYHPSANGNFMDSSTEGGYDGASSLGIVNKTTTQDDLTEFYKTNYIYQNIEVDGGCFYDLYIKYDGSGGKDNSSLGLRYNIVLIEDMGIVSTSDSLIGGWSQKQNTSRRHSQDHGLYHNTVTPIFRHIGQDSYISTNMTENDLRFDYQRFFVPSFVTAATGVTIQIQIGMDCIGEMNLEHLLCISAVSVKKSFPDLVHIARESQANTYNHSSIPVLGVPKFSGGEGFTEGLGPSGQYSRLDTVYNGGQFYDRWNTYKLDFTIPEDATNTRDYVLRIYGGRFGYTSQTDAAGIPDDDGASSRYTPMQAVCIDNISIGKKSGGSADDILLLSDSVKATSDALAEASVYSYLTSGAIWNKGFLKWEFPDADTVYSYTNGILKMSDSNFTTNNSNVISYFYYDRPVLGDYNVSGHMTTSDPLNFVHKVHVTEEPDAYTTPVSIMGCHEDMWRNYRIKTLGNLIDMPDEVSPVPDNWHYMHFDWKLSSIANYTETLTNLQNQKYLQNIPIKYVDFTGDNLATRRLLNQTDDSDASKGQFGFGGVVSEGTDGEESTTVGHIYNNPVILPIAGLQHRQYLGEQLIYGSTPVDAFLVGDTITGEELPNPELMQYYFQYYGATIQEDDGRGESRDQPQEDEPDVGEQVVPIPYNENGFCGGTTLTNCLELQYAWAPIVIDELQEPGTFTGPRYMASMNFDLLLVAYGAYRAESTGNVPADEGESVWREVIDCPIPKIKATLLRIPPDVDMGDTLLDSIFDGSLTLDDEISSQILPGSGKTIRQKRDEGGDDLFDFTAIESPEAWKTFGCNIPYRFNLMVPSGLDGHKSVLTSSDNIALKLEILDPRNNIGYLESYIGTEPNGDDTLYHHSLGYCFSKWEARFYQYFTDNFAFTWYVEGQNVRVNIDFKVPTAADNQEILDTSESWAERVFQVGISTVNIFDEESTISIDDNFNVGENNPINMNEAPRISFAVTDALLKHEVIKRINLYMKDNESDIWYLQASVDTFKGTIKSSTNGKEFSYSYRGYTGQVSSLVTVFELSERYLLNFNEIDSYESQSLVSQQDGLVPADLTCRFKTSVHCNNRLYVGNIEQNGRTYGDRMIRTPIGKYNVFPASNYIDVAINDGDEITHLAYFKDKILQFKKRKVFVINVSGDYEYLEDTFDYIGVVRGCQVADTPHGIAWVNAAGCFLYDGEKLKNLISNKIGTEGFQSNPVGTTTNYWVIGIKSDDIPSIGYVASTSKLLIARDVGVQTDTTSNSVGTSIPDGFEYSFQSDGWTFLYKKLSAPPETGDIPARMGQFSNFVNDANGQLIYYVVGASGDASDDEVYGASFNGLYYWDDMPVRCQDGLDEYNDSDSAARVLGQVGDFFYLRTKNFNFDSAHARKKIYKIYVTFKTSDDTGRQNTIHEPDDQQEDEEYRDSRVNVFYACNGETPDVDNNTFLDNTSTNYSADRGLYAEGALSGNITAVADYPSGSHTKDVLITSAGHGLVNGKKIYVTGTTDYNSSTQLNGLHTITKVDNDTFYFEETYTSSQTGTWELEGEAGWHIAELKPTNESDVNNIYSFQLVFICAGKRIANRFEINDITILYRIKPPK